MSAAPGTMIDVGAAAVAPSGKLLLRARATIELTKPRITRLVTMTAGVGFALGGIGRGADVWAWATAGAGCLAGTALSSAGANALNQFLEASRDAKMDRTRGRPIPSGRLGSVAAAVSGLVMCVAGLLVLAMTCGPAAMLLSAATMLTYLLVYTPLKPVTVLNTLVGTVPGALPPVIGWCAGAWMGARASGLSAGAASMAGLAEAGGWSLFALMGVWQLPHFLAIAWMYKDDYARGGYRMLPVLDPTGRTTAAHVAGWSVVLLPATLAPWWCMPERLSAVYPVVALLSGVAYAGLAVRLLRDPTRARARQVFLASIAHLPVLLAALMVSAAVKVLM